MSGVVRASLVIRKEFMQDIIPPHRTPRGSLRTTRVPARVGETISMTSRSTRPTGYTTQTKTVTDIIMPNKEVIVTKTVTTSVMSKPEAATKPIESLTPRAKSEVLQKALLSAQRELRSERRKRRDMKRVSLIFVAVIFVLVTGYVSIDTLMTNNRVKAEGAQSAATAPGASTKEQEGQDEAKPAASALTNYAVAADLPRALSIDKIDVTARVLPMSVNTDGSVQAPRNIYDAGWYTGSVKPGEIGAMFIDGHASGPTREGLFAYLDKLEEGDTLQMEKGDGTKLTYKVVHKEIAPLEGLDMKKMLLPYGNTLRGMNLMTCTGTWVDSKQTYDQRVMIWTEQV